MRIKAFVFIFFLPCHGQSCKGLELNAMTGILGPLPEVKFKLTSFGATRNFLTDRTGTACADLPTGHYTVEVYAKGWQQQTFRFDIEGLPSALVTILKLDRNFDPPVNRVRGKLKGVPFPNNETWAVLTHVLGQERQFAKVASDGSFVFSGYFAGTYQVHTVTKNGRMLACTVVSLSGDGWLELSNSEPCNKSKNQSE